MDRFWGVLMKNRLCRIRLKYTAEMKTIRIKNYKNMSVKILRESESLLWKFSSKFRFSPENLELGRNKKFSHPEVLFDINYEEVRGPQTVAKMISDYFTGVGQSTVWTEIDLSSRRSHKQYFPPTEGESIFLAPVSFAEFQKVIKSMKNGKSVRYDELSTMLLKSIAGVIFKSFIHIFNLFISLPNTNLDLGQVVRQNLQLQLFY